MSLGEISQRGREHLIDVATTAALIDRSEKIEDYHIVEAAECRLFDRHSWVSAINDSSIPEYNGSDCLKFDSWIGEIKVP